MQSHLQNGRTQALPSGASSDFSAHIACFNPNNGPGPPLNNMTGASQTEDQLTTSSVCNHISCPSSSLNSSSQLPLEKRDGTAVTADQENSRLSVDAALDGPWDSLSLG